jgi:hypothetical protein
METLDMSTLPEYDVGGVIHIVVNNQASGERGLFFFLFLLIFSAFFSVITHLLLALFLEKDGASVLQF